jgi:hypothetical protein
VGFFLDLEIDEPVNTFFNEFGGPEGVPGAGQSWEIDEPGFVFGDIFNNFTASDENGSALEGSTAVPVATPDDVSMALAWNFSLGTAESAEIAFLISATPPGGFYLSQTDPDSDYSLYFSSALRISPTGPSNMPEGGTTMALLCGGLFSLGFLRRRR